MSSCRRVVVVVGEGEKEEEEEGEDVHRRTFAESDEKQQSSEIIDFVRRGTRRNGRGWEEGKRGDEKKRRELRPNAY